VSPTLRSAAAPYMQIAESVRTEIMAGRMALGDAVPSERALAIDWGVSRVTASRALAALRVEGLIVSEQGRGTFVCRAPQVSAADRYLASAHVAGKSYGPNESSQVRSADLITGPDHVTAELGLAAQSAVIRRCRTISDGEGPVELSVSWFPGAFEKSSPDLLGTDRLPNGMLRYIAESTGRVPLLSIDTYFAVLLSSQEMSNLGIAVQGPKAALRGHYLISDQENRPLVFVEATYRPGWTSQHRSSMPAPT
jgi:DNA-binding GntR family transcriptional regulator